MRAARDAGVCVLACGGSPLYNPRTLLSLQPGVRLGVYEVVDAIGAGGMGEVYRARDTRLNRDVAIKILPEIFAADADRLARFTREAQMLAALNHPNIAAIYGIEEDASGRALVMELVDGEDLAQRLTSGPLPLEESLSIARQIADALAAAHEQGIIHRDLKPANVKVRPDGTVKVLDFGLAKALDPVVSTPGVSQSPTLTSPAMTGVGLLLGTAAYMSPEQARGKIVDKRSDVWAFGCVLYEMLSGRRPFDGEDVSMTLATVMMKDPDWTALPASVPANVRTVVKRCLEKDRKRRLADIAVAQFLLDEPLTAALPPSGVEGPLPHSRMIQIAITGAAFALAMAAAVGITWWMRRPVEPQPVRFAIVQPSSQPLTIQGFQRDIAISPDGRQIIYRVGPAGTIGTQFAVRSLDQLEARVISGITGVRSPFFSPDGQWIGYFEGANGQLDKVSVFGGPPIHLCTYVGNPLEGSWGPDDTIVFATNDRGTGLLAVSAAGGEPKVLTRPDREHGEDDHTMPFVLPDGKAVLYTVWPAGQSIENAQIAVLDLRSGQKKTLIRGGSDARYVETGHLVYASGGTLRAVRFDVDRLVVTSAPVPVLDNVTTSGTTGTADFAVAANGTLVYVPGGLSAGAIRSLMWVDRQGHEQPLKNAPPRVYVVPRISPDGTRVALDIRDQENDISVWDLKRETLMRLTFGMGLDQSPIWTPDGKRIIFASQSGSELPNLFSVAADNTGKPVRLSMSVNGQTPTSISPDGVHLLYSEVSPKTNLDIRMLPLAPAKDGSVGVSALPTGSPLLEGTFSEADAEVSPDGRWIAYQSNESGLNEVHVRPFPNVDAGHVQISTDGGTRVMWSRNGRELFYFSGSAGAMMAVPVQTTGAVFNAGNPVKLFDATPYFFGIVGRTYDVAPDGRFLMIRLASTLQTGSNPAPRSLIVVEHWTEELKTRVGTK